jgi:hypothetical protein
MCITSGPIWGGFRRAEPQGKFMSEQRLHVQVSCWSKLPYV